MREQTRREALAQKFARQRYDRQTAVDGLPGRRVAGESGAVEIDVHGVEKVRESAGGQPIQRAQVRLGIESLPAKRSGNALSESRGGPREVLRRGEPELARTCRLRDPREQPVIGRIDFDRLLAEGESHDAGFASRSSPRLRRWIMPLRADAGAG